MYKKNHLSHFKFKELQVTLEDIFIDIKFTDRFRYYEAFDEYYKNNISAMAIIFAQYLNQD